MYVVRKWSLRGRNGFVGWNITRVSLWFLCNVYFCAKYAKVFVPQLPCDLADLKARIIAAAKNIDALMSTHVWQELEYRIDVCRVTSGAHIEHLQLSKKKKKEKKKKNFYSFPVAVNNSIKVSPLVFFLQMFVITENIMKSPVYIYEILGLQAS